MASTVSARPTAADVLGCHEVRVEFLTGKSGLVAVDNISLTVREGEMVCWVGPSGCGKSTLLHVVAGLLKPTAGYVTVDGQRITGPSPKVAYMTQRDTLLPWASSLENVLLPIQAIGRSDDRQLAQELLELVGLKGFEKHLPHQLSGGMRKRVQLARALAQRPRLLLMDEPFGALDSQTKIIIQREFLKIWERDRISVVLVSHDLAEAIAMADRIYLISRRPGRLKGSYPVDLPHPRKADGVFTDPEYQEVYRSIWESLEEELASVA